MPLVLADRVQETTTTTGTGAFTLAGAVAGFRTFGAAVGAGNTAYYAAEAVDGDGVPTGDWEVGLGTVGAGTLARTTVLASSNGGNAVDFAAGTKRVSGVAPAASSAAAARTDAANTFSTGPQVLAGGLTVRQSGGTPDEDDVTLVHTGVRAILSALTGTIQVRSLSAGDVQLTPASGSVVCDSVLIPKQGVAGWDGKPLGMAVPGNVSNDAQLLCPVARVVRVAGSSASAPATLASVPLTPAQLTADTDDWNPGVARTYRASCDAPRSVRSLHIGQVDGQECTIVNVGSHALTLVHEAGSGSTASRFRCNFGLDIELDADERATLLYDGTTQRWRAFK